jgi:hypothetical protein
MTSKPKSAHCPRTKAGLPSYQVIGRLTAKSTVIGMMAYTSIPKAAESNAVSGRALIWLLTADEYHGLLSVGDSFTVQEGSRIVCGGKVTALPNAKLQRAGQQGGRANAGICHAACDGRTIEVKLPNWNRSAARGAPAPVVAHL